MHLEVYRQRPDVQAVVHAHPPIATGFAVAGIPLDRAVLAEVVTTLGSVPIAEYATPSTKELPEAVRQVREGARRHAARQPRRADARQGSVLARTTRWRRSSTSRRSASSRGCSAASGCCRARKSIASRGCAAATASPRRRRSAPSRSRICRPTARSCRRRRRPGSGWSPTGLAFRVRAAAAVPADEEIRLTYRELTALIEDAVKKSEVVNSLPAPSFRQPAAAAGSDGRSSRMLTGRALAKLAAGSWKRRSTNG